MIAISLLNFAKTLLNATCRVAHSFTADGMLDLIQVIQFIIQKRASSNIYYDYHDRESTLLLSSEMLIILGIPKVDPLIQDILQNVLRVMAVPLL